MKVMGTFLIYCRLMAVNLNAVNKSRMSPLTLFALATFERK